MGHRREVLVTVLSRTGDGTPDQAVLDAVATALNAEDVRPLTDKVTVRGAQIVPYVIDATIYTFAGPDSSVVITEARARANQYVDDSHRVGREVTISGIYASLHVDGVERVALNSPVADIAITPTQASYCQAVKLTHGGVYAG